MVGLAALWCTSTLPRRRPWSYPKISENQDFYGGWNKQKLLGSFCFFVFVLGFWIFTRKCTTLSTWATTSMSKGCHWESQTSSSGPSISESNIQTTVKWFWRFLLHCVNLRNDDSELPFFLFFWEVLFSQQPCSWVSISGPGPGATFHGRENPEHLAVEPVEPVEPVALEPLHFLNPTNFWNLWNQLNAWGSTGSKHSLGSTTPWVQQVPCRFLGFNHATGSRGFQTGSLGWNTQWFHRFQTGSLGSTTPLVPQVPDRFLGFNHAAGSTGSRQVPWVQPRHWFHSFQTGSLGSNMQWFHRFHTGSLGSTRHWFHRFQTGSLGSTTLWVQQVEPKEPVWNRPRHWFHRFQTGSLGSTVELWELWRVWINSGFV